MDAQQETIPTADLSATRRPTTPAQRALLIHLMGQLGVMADLSTLSFDQAVELIDKLREMLQNPQTGDWVRRYDEEPAPESATGQR